MIDPEEERAKFISLREALFLIAQAKGKTPQGAAQMLLLNLNRTDDWKSLESYRYFPAQGMLSSNSITQELRRQLSRLAEHNDHSAEIDDDIPF